MSNFDYMDFEKLIRISAEAKAYQRNPPKGVSVAVPDLTVEKIREMIGKGSPDELRVVSRYYYRYSGMYARMVDYLSSLLLYRFLYAPLYDLAKPPKQKQIIEGYNKVGAFLEALNVPLSFSTITRKILIDGVYYGIMREDGDNVMIQDLPTDYCRTRFKDQNDMNVVELDVRFFQRMSDSAYRETCLATYPKKVVKHYNDYTAGKTPTSWVEITPSMGGFAFFYNEPVPYLVSSLPDVLGYDEAKDREARRETNELYKLLVLEMPTKDGELIFDLTETAAIHKAISNMLGDNDTVQALTTFGPTHMENVQDAGNATTSNKLEKYKSSVFDEMGTSSQLFNGSGNISITHSIAKDTAFMASWAVMYSDWLAFQINARFSRPNLSFSFEFLPLTLFNQKEMTATYINAAQYGYPKMYAGIALGVSQHQMPSLLNFETSVLKLQDRMIPLQSSYTSTEKNNSGEEKTGGTTAARDTNNEGGRPTIDDANKQDKTIANKDSE